MHLILTPPQFSVSLAGQVLSERFAQIALGILLVDDVILAVTLVCSRVLGL